MYGAIMKSLIFLLIFSFTFSCIAPPEQTIDDNAMSNQDNPHSDGINNDGGDPLGTGVNLESSSSVVQSDIAFKNYAQYNMNLSKATGVDRKRVIDTFNAVKNSLPSANDPSLFNSFTLLSYTRLAFEYCDIFVDEGSLFQSTNFATRSSSLLIEDLIGHFLIDPAADNLNAYDSIRTELNVIYNDDINPGRKYVADVGSNADKKKRLTKMSCAALLASGHFTNYK